jgi:hypothetical protein
VLVGEQNTFSDEPNMLGAPITQHTNAARRIFFVIDIYLVCLRKISVQPLGLNCDIYAVRSNCIDLAFLDTSRTLTKVKVLPSSVLGLFGLFSRVKYCCQH